MKHLRRWMICLSFLLNTVLFITLIFLAIVKTEPVFFAISLVCYPLSLLIIFLARKYINSNCKFYWEPFQTTNGEWITEHIAWRIIKTILMPIVASGALIMHHLITITYTKMNEAIEDKTGFSLSSIGRTCQVCLTYFIALALVFAIAELCGLHKDDVWREAMESIEVTILVFGGIIWLLDTILWDVLDFAQKESAGFIKFKNISFLIIAVLCAIWGLPNLILSEAKDVFEYFGIAIVPICIHFCYYGVIRSGMVPQSKMRYFWGPISIAVVFTYSTLLLNIVSHGRILALLVYFLTVIAFGVVIYFFGVPFMATDGTYRLDYRKLNILNQFHGDNDGKNKKSNGKNKGADDKGKANNNNNNNNNNISDIYFTMTNVANDVLYPYISARWPGKYDITRCVASDIDISIEHYQPEYLYYKISQKVTLDLTECKNDWERKSIRDEYERYYDKKMEEIKNNLISQTHKSLKDQNIDVKKESIHVKFDNKQVEELT